MFFPILKYLTARQTKSQLQLQPQEINEKKLKQNVSIYYLFPCPLLFRL